MSPDTSSGRPPGARGWRDDRLVMAFIAAWGAAYLLALVCAVGLPFLPARICAGVVVAVLALVPVAVGDVLAGEGR